MSTLHQTVRRCIRPSASNVDTHRGTPPDDLIVIDRLDRRRHPYGTISQSLTQQSKCLITVTTEHRIMDTGHQRGLVRKRWRQRNLFLPECCSRIGEIELVKDTMTPVLSQCTPVLLTEGGALGKETAQIGLIGYFFG